MKIFLFGWLCILSEKRRKRTRSAVEYPYPYKLQPGCMPESVGYERVPELVPLVCNSLQALPFFTL